MIGEFPYPMISEFPDPLMINEFPLMIGEFQLDIIPAANTLSPARDGDLLSDGDDDLLLKCPRLQLGENSGQGRGL